MSAYPHKGIAHGARKEKAGGLPALRQIKTAFLTYRSPQGDCGIFLFDRLFPFPRALPIIRQKPTAGRVHQKVCALFLCREMQISVISR